MTRTATGEPRLHLYFFRTRTCPHCRQARPFVDALPADYSWLELHSYDMTRDMAGGIQYARMAEALGEVANAVPAFLFCGRMIPGFDRPETTGRSCASNWRIVTAGSPSRPPSNRLRSPYRRWICR